MTKYIALLRGINVGGHNLLPMAELRSMVSALGFSNVHTYIQSGNVLFESVLSEARVIEKLGNMLERKMQHKVAVVVRTTGEMEVVLARNPFPDANPTQVGVLFLTNPVPGDVLDNFDSSGPEEIVISGREWYIHFPNGMGRSKLKLPKALEQGTVRNINTIQKLVGLVAKG